MSKVELTVVLSATRWKPKAASCAREANMFAMGRISSLNTNHFHYCLHRCPSLLKPVKRERRAERCKILVTARVEIYILQL